ncbi:MauE/DoxX family redox-associated membrane protein [Nocardiopsis composta]|uniref:Methylamine utilisation protein MauE domain-containing protein n=1 Tax=Nocardiopsis composta TaxID=157465 RepID=A0A7W8QMZ1_9ACTN|nr:MauE/DoxX family redox-associated membrane protein [Nocardiopsis composta]MBB5433442.1 hypothetical protein [Nocardiopsis composta]
MLATLLQIQPPIVALMLLLGAAAKAADRSAAGQGPASLLPRSLHRPFQVLAVAAEALLAVALLVLGGPLGDLARGAAAVLFAASAAALVVVRRRDPGMGCGCFGGLSTTPVGWRSIGRAGLLAAASAASIGAAGTGTAVLADPTWAAAGLAAVELGAILALSPELNEAVARVARREPCEVRPVPVRRTMNRLRASDVWRSVPATLDSEKPQPVDVWRNGCWRLFRFDGRRYGRPVHVVFAVELHGRDPQVRAAVIDIGNGATLAVLGEIADDGSTPLPRNRNGVPQPTNTVLPRTPRRFPGRNIPSARRSRDRIADTGSGPGQPN